MAVVVVNWNGREDTAQCLASLRRLEYPNFRIVVVDNGSTDGSLEFLRGLGEEIDLVESGENLGFAGGSNLGVRHALEALSPDYVLLLNNDTEVEPDLLGQLVGVARGDGRIALVQPKILYHGSRRINSTGCLCDVLGATWQRGMGEEDRGQYDRLREEGFFYASGACLLVSRDLLAALGGEPFDGELFAYYEDVELSWRARLLGLRVVYCPAAVCLHREGRTSGGPSARTMFWNFRNRVRVMVKAYSLANLLRFLPIAVAVVLSKALLVSLLRRDPRYLAASLRALGWNAVNLRRTLGMRRVVQAGRRVRDGEVMRYMEREPLEYRFLRRGQPGGP